jgi:hypothetical protein
MLDTYFHVLSLRVSAHRDFSVPKGPKNPKNVLQVNINLTIKPQIASPVTLEVIVKVPK